MSQPHPDDIWRSKYGVKVLILSLPKNKDVYFRLLEGHFIGKCFQETRKKFVEDFVKVEET